MKHSRSFSGDFICMRLARSDTVPLVSCVKPCQAITARVFAEDDIAAGRLRLLFEDTRQKGYYLVTRPGVMRPPLRLFATWLRREAAKAK